MKNCKCTYDNKLEAVVLVLIGFLSFDKFTRIASKTHDLRKKNNSIKQLNDIRQMKVLSNDIQDWIENIWFSAAVESGLKYFAFVVPEDKFGRLTMKNVNDYKHLKFNIKIKYFTDINEAEEWLLSK